MYVLKFILLTVFMVAMIVAVDDRVYASIFISSWLFYLGLRLGGTQDDSVVENVKMLPPVPTGYYPMFSSCLILTFVLLLSFFFANVMVVNVVQELKNVGFVNDIVMLQRLFVFICNFCVASLTFCFLYLFLVLSLLEKLMPVFSVVISVLLSTGVVAACGYLPEKLNYFYPMAHYVSILASGMSASLGGVPGWIVVVLVMAAVLNIVLRLYGVMRWFFQSLYYLYIKYPREYMSVSVAICGLALSLLYKKVDPSGAGVYYSSMLSLGVGLLTYYLKSRGRVVGVEGSQPVEFLVLTHAALVLYGANYALQGVQGILEGGKYFQEMSILSPHIAGFILFMLIVPLTLSFSVILGFIESSVSYVQVVVPVNIVYGVVMYFVLFVQANEVVPGVRPWFPDGLDGMNIFWVQRVVSIFCVLFFMSLLTLAGLRVGKRMARGRFVSSVAGG